MRTPWRLSGILAVVAALPVSAQELEDGAQEAPPDRAVTQPDVPEAPPRAVVPQIDAVELPADEVTPRPALGVRFFRGTQVVVADVLDGSPADLAGLVRGDRIVSFNGTLPATTDEFIALVASAPMDAASQIVLVRGGERHAIAIEPNAWNVIFSEPHVAARFDLEADDAPHAPAAVPSPPYYHAPYYYPPYYVSNVSPVVVPASWYVPYPYPYPYYYTAYWGYYPAWYYNAYVPGYYWPYYWNYPAAWGTPGDPDQHHHHYHDADETPDQDSAALNAPRTVTAHWRH